MDKMKIIQFNEEAGVISAREELLFCLPGVYLKFLIMEI